MNFLREPNVTLKWKPSHVADPALQAMLGARFGQSIARFLVESGEHELHGGSVKYTCFTCAETPRHPYTRALPRMQTMKTQMSKAAAFRGKPKQTFHQVNVAVKVVHATWVADEQ
jgi:hypothetical protein